MKRSSRIKKAQACALQALRLSHQVTQRGLATMVGLSVRTIEGYEGGNLDIPLSRFIVMCRALKVSGPEIARFFEGTLRKCPLELPVETKAPKPTPAEDQSIWDDTDTFF